MSEFKEYHNANHHDGDDTFDDQKYKMTNGEDFVDQFVQDCFDHFKAGQQSQQAKIDELQPRVDEIASHVDINFDEDRDDDQHSYWSGYNQAMRELNDILKGKEDEN